MRGASNGSTRRSRPGSAAAGHGRVARDPAAPRALGRHADPDARPPGHGPRAEPAVFDPEPAGLPWGAVADGEIELVVGQGDAEGAREIAGAAAQLGLGDLAAARRTPAGHEPDSVDRRQRTK